MKEEKITITMIGSVPTENEINALVENAKQFNVKAIFNNLGDYFSNWDLEGTKAELVNFLNGTNHWPDWKDYPEESFEDEEDLKKLL